MLAASAYASTVTVYSNFSEDPTAGLGSYPYACSDAQCSNLLAYAGDQIAVNHDNLTIKLESDANGLPSGNVIETLSANPSIAEDSETLLNLFSSSRPLLQAGQRYWVVASLTNIDLTDTSQDTFFGWMENQQGATWSYTINQ